MMVDARRHEPREIAIAAPLTDTEHYRERPRVTLVAGASDFH